VQQWARVDKLTVELEGHGREPFIPGIDVSRTIGWFTSQYPVILDMTRAENLSHTIKGVKETLRRVPHKGIDYGILRYLTPTQKRKGEIRVKSGP